VAIDISILSKITVGVFLLVAGGLINRIFERRARLVVFYGQIGEFHLNLQPPGIVRTHAVVIRNVGRDVAKNVHVPHHGLLSVNNIHVSVHPPIAYTVQTLPNNTEEILFPALPAKFQVNLSYLYFPPTLYNQINGQIFSDDGPARVINVLPQVQLPWWVLAVLWALIGIGLITVCYGLWVLARWVA
jgi:hypothetical protein